MSKAMQLASQFATSLRDRDQQAKIRRALPKDVSLEKFTDVCIQAIHEDPSLLAVDNKMSIFLACSSAAKDGLMPDKREGALVVYSIKNKETNRWETAVQWQPMILGLRKRLALVGFDLRAHVVYKHDGFDYDLGDNEQITHKPVWLGEDRGPIIGAYAISTRKSDGEKWREVMNVDQLNLVKDSSKAGDRGPWGPWYDEMCRKTVAKRLYKSLPLHDNMFQGIIDRDNEQYDLGEPEPAPTRAQTIQKEARESVKPAPKKAPSRKKATQRKPEPKPAPEKAPIEGVAQPIETPPDEPVISPEPPTEEGESEKFVGIDPGF